MNSYFAKEYFDGAFATIPASWRDFKPTVGVILGSGWGRTLLDRPFEDSIPYSAIPGFGASTVIGHAGEARLIDTGKRRVIAFCGRRHFYEGEGWGPVVMPIEIMRRLGVRNLLLTNAAGGVNETFNAGDFMMITDQISGFVPSPLAGPNIETQTKRLRLRSDRTRVRSMSCLHALNLLRLRLDELET